MLILSSIQEMLILSLILLFDTLVIYFKIRSFKEGSFIFLLYNKVDHPFFALLIRNEIFILVNENGIITRQNKGL